MSKYVKCPQTFVTGYRPNVALFQICAHLWLECLMLQASAFVRIVSKFRNLIGILLVFLFDYQLCVQCRVAADMYLFVQRCLPTLFIQLISVAFKNLK